MRLIQKAEERIHSIANRERKCFEQKKRQNISGQKTTVDLSFKRSGWFPSKPEVNVFTAIKNKRIMTGFATLSSSA